MENVEIAHVLSKYADLLEIEGEDTIPRDYELGSKRSSDSIRSKLWNYWDELNFAEICVPPFRE